MDSEARALQEVQEGHFEGVQVEGQKNKNNKICFKRAKVGEHTFFATFFIFFSSRTEKCY